MSENQNIASLKERYSSEGSIKLTLLIYFNSAYIKHDISLCLYKNAKTNYFAVPRKKIFCLAFH